MQNIDPCSLLTNFIKSRNHKVTYADCLFYLNNRTNLSQIEIHLCLNKFFPNNYLYNNINWSGIL